MKARATPVPGRPRQGPSDRRTRRGILGQLGPILTRPEPSRVVRVEPGEGFSTIVLDCDHRVTGTPRAVTSYKARDPFPCPRCPPWR